LQNAACPHPKILNLYWAGARYTALPGLDVTGAFQGYHQNGYGAAAYCNNTSEATCAGTFKAFSLDAGYAFSKRFDAYLGAMWSEVAGGVANGYIYPRCQHRPDHRRSLQVLSFEVDEIKSSEAGG
jgi:predicted porin